VFPFNIVALELYDCHCQQFSYPVPVLRCGGVWVWGVGHG